MKAYFDKGWALTNYFKYAFAFVGLYDLVDAGQALFIGMGYCIFCFLFGWWWFNTGVIDTENEINNLYNPFQREVREKLKKKTFK